MYFCSEVMKNIFNILFQACVFVLFTWVVGYNRSVTSLVPVKSEGSESVITPRALSSSILEDSGFFRIRARLNDHPPVIKRFIKIIKFIDGNNSFSTRFQSPSFVLCKGPCDIESPPHLSLHKFNKVFLI